MKKAFVQIGIFSILLALLDQAVKWIAGSYLIKPLVLAPWASLRYEQNTGIAWSIPVPQPWLNYAIVILLIFIPFFIAGQIDLRKKNARIYLSMIMGGAIGNLFDRLVHGYVVDYVSVGWWPVFNLADALLCAGIFLIIVFYGKIKRV